MDCCKGHAPSTLSKGISDKTSLEPSSLDLESGGFMDTGFGTGTFQGMGMDGIKHACLSNVKVKWNKLDL